MKPKFEFAVFLVVIVPLLLALSWVMAGCSTPPHRTLAYYNEQYYGSIFEAELNYGFVVSDDFKVNQVRLFTAETNYFNAERAYYFEQRLKGQK